MTWSHAAIRASFCLLNWSAEKEAVPESLQAFEVAAAWTCFLLSKWFLEHEHPLIDNSWAHCTKRTTSLPGFENLSFRIHTVYMWWEAWNPKIDIEACVWMLYNKKWEGRQKDQNMCLCVCIKPLLFVITCYV